MKSVCRLGSGLFGQFIESCEKWGKTDTVANPDLRFSIRKVESSVCAVDLHGVADAQALRQAVGVVITSVSSWLSGCQLEAMVTGWLSPCSRKKRNCPARCPCHFGAFRGRFDSGRIRWHFVGCRCA